MMRAAFLEERSPAARTSEFAGALPTQNSARDAAVPGLAARPWTGGRYGGQTLSYAKLSSSCDSMPTASVKQPCDNDRTGQRIQP